MRNNPQQALTKGKEREKNVENIFAVNHPEEMYRKHVLVVDDVITTGSTIRSFLDAMCHEVVPVHAACFIEQLMRRNPL